MKFILIGLVLSLSGCATTPNLPNCLSLVKVKLEVCPTD